MGKHGQYRALVTAAAGLLGLACAPAAASCRLALALGMDVSRSVDDNDYAIQRDGLLAALADFAEQSGRAELKDAPWLLWGHSGGSSWSAQMIVRHPGRVLAAALVHDLSEIATGDVPAPVKRNNPELKSVLNKISTDWEIEHGIRFDLDRHESYLLLWCDRMDFALYALEEVCMGNRLFLPYLNRIVFWLSKMEYPCILSPSRVLPAAVELLGAVAARTEQVLGFPVTTEDYHEHF